MTSIGASSIPSGMSVNGWTVVRKLSKGSGEGGGGFSSGYEVVNGDGTAGYLKAFNLMYALSTLGVDPMTALKQITDDYVHEKELVDFCNTRGLSRIVIAMDSGYVPTASVVPVPYLVFEFSRNGSVERHSGMAQVGLKWRLRVFHGVCVGLAQLHKYSVAHQDLKPANVLVFNNNESKIADLGRATQDKPGSRYSDPFSFGDFNYAPFELCYGHSESEWDDRRKSADLFMLGGLLAYLVSNINIRDLTFSKMDPNLRPSVMSSGGRRTAYVVVVDYVRVALYDAIEDVVGVAPEKLRADLRILLKYLCEPSPCLRGHPYNVSACGGNRYSLERIISLADRLATREELGV